MKSVSRIGIALLAMGIMFLVSSCGRFERTIASYTGSSEMCIDGVKYIQFISGASVKYKPDGTIVSCK